MRKVYVTIGQEAERDDFSIVRITGKVWHGFSVDILEEVFEDGEPTGDYAVTESTRMDTRELANYFGGKPVLREAEEIAEKINEAYDNDEKIEPALLEKLCSLADLSELYEGLEGDKVYDLAYKAADKLDVCINLPF